MVSIKDIAREADVSIAAVSYALNGKNGVNKETRKRIEQIAERLGYVPNLLARGLVTRRTNIIGVLVSNISNEYCSRFIHFVEKYAKLNNLYLLLGCTNDCLEKELDLIECFTARNVDGLIIFPSNYYDEGVYKKIIAYIQKSKTPFVFANLMIPNIKCNYVVSDLESGFYTITNYLLDKGYSDLVFVCGDVNNYYCNSRFKGFCDAMSERNIPITQQNYIECGKGLSFIDGYEVVDRILENNSLPQAFITINDFVAFGMIKRLREKGFLIPHDISIVGYDNICIPTLDGLGLTTMETPIEDIARLCVETLTDRKDSDVLKQYLLKSKLVIKDSVK